jgi:hypothetical protein
LRSHWFSTVSGRSRGRCTPMCPGLASMAAALSTVPLPGALDLEGVNFVLCVGEQSIPEGRYSFLIGAGPGLLPVQVRDGV